MKCMGANRSRMLAPADFPIIKSGAIHTLQFSGRMGDNRVLWIEDLTGGFWKSTSPLSKNKYTLSVTYTNTHKTRAGAGVPVRDNSAIQTLWTGKITSNEITLNCTPESANELSLDLAVSPVSWKAGDTVNVTCTVRNVSKKPQRFLAWGIEFANTLEITDVKTNKVVRKDGGRNATRRLTIDAYPLVQPGAEKKFYVQGTVKDNKRDGGASVTFSTPEKAGGLLWWNLTKGRSYSVKAVLHITENDIKRYPRNLHKEQETLWKGKIFSKPVTVRIPGQPKTPEDIF
jgi:hypothetical protein